MHDYNRDPDCHLDRLSTLNTGKEAIVTFRHEIRPRKSCFRFFIHQQLLCIESPAGTSKLTKAAAYVQIVG